MTVTILPNGIPCLTISGDSFLSGSLTVSSSAAANFTITSNVAHQELVESWGVGAAEFMADAEAWSARAGQGWSDDVSGWHVTGEPVIVQSSSATTQLTIENTSGLTFGSDAWVPVLHGGGELSEERARQIRERQYAEDNAKWRARELLLRNLTPKQQDDYLYEGRFTVKTKRGHRYVIGKNWSQNIVRVNRRGKPMRVYCVSVHGNVPLEDSILGQKLMLEHDEDHFLKVARQWPVRFACGVGDLVPRSRAGGLSVVPLDAQFIYVNGERLAG